ncbi:MAG: tetratricopeptide repeat protein [Burkholderiales bacterium]
MRIQVFLVALALSLPACAQHGKYRIAPSYGPERGATGSRFPDAMLLAQSEGSEDIVVQPAEAPPKPLADKSMKLPSHALTRDLLYKFLLAEIAGQRGNVRLAARAYLELAQSTKDPRVARRATEIAQYGRFPDMAAEAASVWLDIEPESQQARQTLIATLLGNQRIAEAKPMLQKLLAADKTRTGAMFLQLNPILSRHPDRAATLAMVKELAVPYPALPEAHVAVAQAAFGANNFELAQTETAEALRLKRSFEPAAIMNAQLLQRDSIQKAIAYLHGYLGENAGARDARLYYARLLAADRKTEPARNEFLALEKEAPGNPEIQLMIGLLSMQLQDWDTATARLKKALDLNYRDPDTVRFYLGQIAEERKDLDGALGWYGQVQQGDQVVPAAARYALILARQQKFAEARSYLKGVPATTDAHRVLLAQSEAQVLREGKQYQEAFDTIGASLEEFPDNPDLLYDHAMAAEKIDRLDVLEARLKRLIELRPEHAQAYNALGYTFADRNVRLPEARDFIEKALKLSPEDAFILDSMGWVHYRLGDLDQGLSFLQRAFRQRPDPEIAAHLGEVLWVKGSKTEAERIWRASLKDHPTNEELQAAIRKFVR